MQINLSLVIDFSLYSRKTKSFSILNVMLQTKFKIRENFQDLVSILSEKFSDLLIFFLVGFQNLFKFDINVQLI